MIKKGSNVVLQTKDAVYTTCEIIELGAKSITVSYCTGIKKDRKTGKMYMERRNDTISRKDIISISERL